MNKRFVVSAVLFALLVSGVTVLALPGHEKPNIGAHTEVAKSSKTTTTTPSSTPTASHVVAATQTSATSVTTNSTAPVTTTSSSRSASSNSKSSSSSASKNKAPTKPVDTITFSADGCYVTATGTPGLILTGADHTIPATKGGPMGAPGGIVIPASGTVGESITTAPFSYLGWGIDAVLSDPSGNVVATNSTVVTAALCS